MTYFDNRVWFDSVSMVTATPGPNDPELGDRRKVGDEEYVFVYNDGGSNILVGDAAALSAVSGYSVTVTMTTGVAFVVGVNKHATITTGAYAWLLTRGFTNINMAATQSVAVNGILAQAANGKFAAQSVALGYPGNPLGQAQTAMASGASGPAFISVW